MGVKLWILCGILIAVAVAAIVWAIVDDLREKRRQGVDWKGRVFPPPDEP